MSGDPSGSAIQTSYLTLLRELPAPLRPLARSLPRHLGLSRRDEGGFEDFTRCEALRELPAFAAEGLTISAVEEARYRTAHHRGGFWGLLADRLADQQVEQLAPALRQLERVLLLRWARSLREAASASGSDPTLVLRLRCCAQRQWLQALRWERQALTGPPAALRLGTYAAIVVNKVRWLSVAALALLLPRVETERLRCFVRAFDLTLLGMQVADDCLDATEDAAVYGQGYPAALGLPAGGLWAARPHLLRGAARHARRGGFERLAACVEQQAALAELSRCDGDPLHNEFAALLIATSLEEAPCQSIT